MLWLAPQLHSTTLLLHTLKERNIVRSNSLSSLCSVNFHPYKTAKIIRLTVGKTQSALPKCAIWEMLIHNDHIKKNDSIITKCCHVYTTWWPPVLHSMDCFSWESTTIAELSIFILAPNCYCNLVLCIPSTSFYHSVRTHLSLMDGKTSCGFLRSDQKKRSLSNLGSMLATVSLPSG